MAKGRLTPLTRHLRNAWKRGRPLSARSYVALLAEQRLWLDDNGTLWALVYRAQRAPAETISPMCKVASRITGKQKILFADCCTAAQLVKFPLEEHWHFAALEQFQPELKRERAAFLRRLGFPKDVWVADLASEVSDEQEGT